MTQNSDVDVDELIADHKAETGEGRHATEAAIEREADRPTLEDAIADAYGAIDAGDISSNLTLRDENLAALFHGLEASGRLADVGEQAAADLERPDADTQTRAAVLRLLVRVALESIDADVIEAGKEGRTRYLDADEF